MILSLQTESAEMAAPASGETAFHCLLAASLFVCLKEILTVPAERWQTFPLRAKWNVNTPIAEPFSVGGRCLVTSSSRKHHDSESVPSDLCTAAPIYGPWVSLTCWELNQQPICFSSRSDCKHFSRTVNSPPPRRTSTSKSVQSATLQEADWGEPEEHPTAARSR